MTNYRFEVTTNDGVISAFEFLEEAIEFGRKCSKDYDLVMLTVRHGGSEIIIREWEGEED